MPVSCGERFCIFHPAVTAPRGGLVYVHPFAEEMNKSRRMVALQSRMLAARGYAVLQIDLYGCGDSSGDFADASWEIWREDIVLAVQWLRGRVGAAVALWGLRLGALLALDAARHCDPEPQAFVLWQPVVSGEALLTQFLRLRLASEMLSEGSSKGGVQGLRAALAQGSPVEIAGYALRGPLAAAMDSLKLVDLSPIGKAAHWLEVVPEAGRNLPPAAQRVAESWIQKGVKLDVQCVAGQPFWNTLEITECPELLAATEQVFARGLQ